MVESYTANQGIEKPATGEQSGTWGATVNTNMDIIDRAISGVVALTITGSTTTLTTTDGTLTDGMYRVLVLRDDGDVGSNNTITISPNDQDKLYLVYNNLTANRSAIFTQGSGANATVENGETAWIYADGAGSGAVVRTAISSTKLLDQDGDTGIRVEEGGDDDDTIRFDIAGAEDFTITANTFNVLSSSDLNINSGGTLTNAGTAYGFDNLPAFAGIIEANATFVDQAIFGPSVDGTPWNGRWTANDSSGDLLYSSLMLVTIEDATADTQINIWDLTEQSAGAISTTAIATVTLSGDATPTSVAACMGYLIVGSEDGISIVDPHSGTWAERTIGWPKTLSTSTSPALTNADVKGVAAGFSDQPAHDPRTGGPMPVFWVAYGTGADVVSLLKDDGNVWDAAGTIGSTGVGADNNGFGYYADSGNRIVRNVVPVSAITADDWTEERIVSNNNYPSGIFPGTTFDTSGGHAAGGGTGGLSFITGIHGAGTTSAADKSPTAAITRAYNTGYMVGDIRGVWLASTIADSSNEGEKDRTYHANNLTQNGTPTEGAVASGAELRGYSGFTDVVNYEAASNAEWDEIGTGSVYLSCWFKVSSGSQKYFINFGNSGATVECILLMDGSGRVEGRDDGATAQVYLQAAGDLRDSKWHKGDFVRVSSTERYLYVDGVLKDSSTTDAGSLSDDGNLPLFIGVLAADGSSGPASNSELSLAKISATAPNATEVRQMYDAEKGMFEASAECTLQGGSDAVLDVDIDPLTGKVLVTQSDAITVFDGLVVDKLFADAGKPTKNAGDAEKGKLWGDLRTEQNTVNAYATVPVTDQRQVNEMVRGLASDLPKGVDLSKAKAWLTFDQKGPYILGSYNVKSVEDVSAGYFKVTWAIPFKSEGGSNYQITALNRNSAFYGGGPWSIEHEIAPFITYSPGTTTGSDSDDVFVVAFGELENE